MNVDRFFACIMPVRGRSDDFNIKNPFSQKGFLKGSQRIRMIISLYEFTLYAEQKTKKTKDNEPMPLEYLKLFCSISDIVRELCNLNINLNDISKYHLN